MDRPPSRTTMFVHPYSRIPAPSRASLRDDQEIVRPRSRSSSCSSSTNAFTEKELKSGVIVTSLTELALCLTGSKYAKKPLPTPGFRQVSLSFLTDQNSFGLVLLEDASKLALLTENMSAFYNGKTSLQMICFIVLNLSRVWQCFRSIATADDSQSRRHLCCAKSDRREMVPWPYRIL